jgi:hypothetical protein
VQVGRAGSVGRGHCEKRELIRIQAIKERQPFGLAMIKEKEVGGDEEKVGSYGGWKLV